ncbi:MAG: methylamine dehydrogenase accessory protein MauD [Curvibacter sp.]|nr:methylamine dehydrogenase accessory protein MauD [Curvibacter sp.]
MTETLIISNILAWCAVIALVVAVLALSRQVGILYERIAPMGALMMDAGPAVGSAAPRLDVRSLNGELLHIGAPAARSTLLFFLSPTCPVCKKLLPILDAIRRDEAPWLQVVLASDGEQPEHEVFRQKAGLGHYPYLLSQELGMSFRIAKLPYAVLIDGQGVLRAKGLVNSREQIDSLFTASDLRVASVQDYIDQTQLNKEPA